MTPEKLTYQRNWRKKHPGYSRDWNRLARGQVVIIPGKILGVWIDLTRTGQVLERVIAREQFLRLTKDTE
jgi:hypothetical protein